MQTMTLAIGGGAVIAATLVAAVILRPIQDDMRAKAAAENAPASEQVEVADLTATEPEVTTEPEPEPETEAVDVAASAPEAEETPEGEAEVADIAQQADVPMVPTVLDRRFEPDGAWLLSGMAQPNVPLVVMVDGVEVERVDVLGDGSFLMTGFLGLSDRPRVLTLISDPEGLNLAAERTYILDASPAPVEVAVAAEPTEQADSDVVAVDVTEATETDIADQDIEIAEATTPEADPAAAETIAVVEQPVEPAVLSVSEDGVEVVQPAIFADSPPEVMSTVALDTITYDPEGEVVLRGRAIGAGFVQVYVDNTPVSRLPVDENGRWRGDLPDVDKGVYTLRIDEVDVEGTVVSRIETPFLREDPLDVAEAMADEVDNPEFTIATRTVQPGATLWAIAEERYGSGVLYVSVFEANRDRIRDPDLIYPGQVFMLPEDDS